jgi:Ni,Fe-hydrogenase III small subunit/ferredoxin
MSLQWLARGLGGGRVTTAYPVRAEEPPTGFRGRVDVLDPRGGDPSLERLCPTGAIAVGRDGRVSLDRGRCILCGGCVEREPERFAFRASYETAGQRRESLVAGDVEGELLPALRESLGERVRALRRSVHIRHVDAGSDGAEEWEIQALTNPYYDIHRLGLFFTAAPRHADVLLVTGGVTHPMRAPLERTFNVMPEPKAVVAAGTDACSGGLASAVGTTAGGVDEVLPVDVYVPGSPPAPIALLHGLLLAIGLVAERTTS